MKNLRFEVQVSYLINDKKTSFSKRVTTTKASLAWRNALANVPIHSTAIKIKIIPC